MVQQVITSVLHIEDLQIKPWCCQLNQVLAVVMLQMLSRQRGAVQVFILKMQATDAICMCFALARHCLTWPGGFSGQLHEEPHSLGAVGTQSQCHESSATERHTALQQHV